MRRKHTADLDDDALLDLVQRQTLRYFWDFAHPACGLARERSNVTPSYGLETVTTGGTGFGVMAIIVGVSRGWIARAAAVDRLWTMVRFLLKADSYHGILPHFLNGDTGRTIPFSRKDDGGDLVETSFLLAGLLCARQYFDAGRRGRRPAARRDRLAVARGRVELAHPGRPQRALLALEPEQRLEHEPRDPRLERVPDHLCAGGLRAALSRSPRRSITAAGRTAAISATGARSTTSRCRSGRTTAARCFFATTPSSASIRAACSDRYADYWQQNLAHTRDQPRALRAQPERLQGLRPGLLGPDRERQPPAATTRIRRATTSA